MGNGTATDLQGLDDVYTATITTDADGETTIDVAAGSATDVAGNANVAAKRVTVQTDTSKPTIAITGPTNVQPVHLPRHTRSIDPVTGFAVEDISVTNGTVSEFAGTDAVYTATISPATDGSIAINVAADAAISVSGAGKSSGTNIHC